jgi:hypothetical protein
MAASFSITRVSALWGRLNSSFWFVPAAMALSAIALSFVLIEVDALRDVAQTDNPRYCRKVFFLKNFVLRRPTFRSLECQIIQNSGHIRENS